MNTTMHVSLFVSDIKRSVKFYTEMFGKEPDELNTAHFKYDLEKPSLFIQFQLDPDRVQSEFGSLGLRLDDHRVYKSEYHKARIKGWIDDDGFQSLASDYKSDRFCLVDPDGYRWIIYFAEEIDSSSLNRDPISNSSTNSTQAVQNNLSLNDLGKNAPHGYLKQSGFLGINGNTEQP